MPLLHPDLWTGPGQLLLALLGVSLVVQVAVLARRRWSVPLAAANLAADAGLLAVVAWGALDERLLNTRFLALLAERAELDQVPTISPWVPIVLVAVVVVWDSAEALLSARRSSST